MIDPNIRFKNDVDRIEQIVFNNIAIKLATYAGFKKSLEDNFNETVKNFPLLYFMVESLHVDCVLSVCKLVEGKQRSERTLHILNDFVENNLPAISKQYPLVTQSLIDSARTNLDEVAEVITRIITQRDKYYAHSDKKYFLEPGKLLIDFPNTHEDLIQIVRTLQTVINSYHHALYKSWRVCMSDFAFLNTFKTIELLEKANNEWEEKYRRPTDQLTEI